MGKTILLTIPPSIIGTGISSRARMARASRPLCTRKALRAVQFNCSRPEPANAPALPASGDPPELADKLVLSA